VPNIGMADPHIRVSPTSPTFLLFATHDFSPNNTNFLMKDWWVWSSDDLVHWNQSATIKPSSTFLSWDKQADECWATDGALKDGVWYWYLSVSPSEVGVVKSSNGPAGPWTDPIGGPLLSDALGKSLNPPATFRDPGILRDDDGSFYIISGVFTYYMSKLGEDMASLAETPRLVEVDPNGHAAWGPYGQKTDDKPFLHKHNGTYYLSWGCFYGISSSPYGPYLFQGSVINRANLSDDFRTAADPGKPWWRQEEQQDRHGSLVTHKNQWYYASNDRSHSSDLAHRSYYRDTVVGYVHYRSNGSIAPVVINAQGVGSYHGSFLQAENFFGADQAVKFHIDGDQFGVQVSRQTGVLEYPSVSRMTNALSLRMKVLGSCTLKVVIEGDLVGLCNMTETVSSSDYEEVQCKLGMALLATPKKLVLEVVAEGEVSIDSFRFLQS